VGAGRLTCPFFFRLQRRHFLPVLLVPQKLATAFQSSPSEPHFPSRLHSVRGRNSTLLNSMGAPLKKECLDPLQLYAGNRLKP